MKPVALKKGLGFIALAVLKASIILAMATQPLASAGTTRIS
jgi:hypothetical protein